MMQKPKVMTKKSFQWKTIPPIVRKSLQNIDHSLDSWEKQSTKVNHSRNILLLASLFVEIKAYKERKRNKMVENPTNNLRKRWQVVEELERQALDRMKWEQFTMRKMGAHHASPRGLSRGHAHERELFRNLKQHHGRDPGWSPSFGGGSLVSAHYEVRDQLVGVPQDVAGIMANANFENLTFAQFQRLANYFSGSNMSMQNPVHYARKEERINKYMLLPWGGQYCRPPMVPYTSGSGTDFVDMYAMDRYGNMMSVKSSQLLQDSSGAMSQFNHSSLNAGNDVICAGTIVIYEGKVKYLSNDSGHYKPSKKDLHDCLQAIVDEEHVELTDDAVIHCTAPPQMHWTRWRDFYNNVNAAGVPDGVDLSTLTAGCHR